MLGMFDNVIVIDYSVILELDCWVLYTFTEPPEYCLLGRMINSDVLLQCCSMTPPWIVCGYVGAYGGVPLYLLRVPVFSFVYGQGQTDKNQNNFYVVANLQFNKVGHWRLRVFLLLHTPGQWCHQWALPKPHKSKLWARASLGSYP